MKAYIKYLLTACILLLSITESQAQYGNSSGYGYGNSSSGRGGSSIPQATATPEAPKPKTADELVDDEMPAIAETLGLDEFEKAVMSSTLKKYVQERIEIQILKLPPEKTRKAYEKIRLQQDADLKAGLPLEKYNSFIKMQKEGLAKMRKEQKKAEKKAEKKKKKSKE